MRSAILIWHGDAGGASLPTLLLDNRFHLLHALGLATTRLDLPLRHTLLKFFRYGSQVAPLVPHARGSLASDGTGLLGEFGELRGSDKDEAGYRNDDKLAGTESEEGWEVRGR